MKSEDCINSDTTEYSGEYDAYYNGDTLEWLSPKCGDDSCDFCSSRPEKVYILSRFID